MEEIMPDSPGREFGQRRVAPDLFPSRRWPPGAPGYLAPGSRLCSTSTRSAAISSSQWARRPSL